MKKNLQTLEIFTFSVPLLYIFTTKHTKKIVVQNMVLKRSVYENI